MQINDNSSSSTASSFETETPETSSPSHTSQEHFHLASGGRKRKAPESTPASSSKQPTMEEDDPIQTARGKAVVIGEPSTQPSPRKDQQPNPQIIHEEWSEFNNTLTTFGRFARYREETLEKEVAGMKKQVEEVEADRARVQRRNKQLMEVVQQLLQIIKIWAPADEARKVEERMKKMDE